jgi:hypothetical protein
MARSPSIFNRDNRSKFSSTQILDMSAKRSQERFGALPPLSTHPGPQNRFQGRFRPGNGRFLTRASADLVLAGPGFLVDPGGWSGAMV